MDKAASLPVDASPRRSTSSIDLMETRALLANVSDQTSFLAFAKRLQEDRAHAVELERSTPSPPYGADAGRWENTTIEAYLAAAISWAQDSKFGLSQGLSASNPWQLFATFLYCGKIYE